MTRKKTFNTAGLCFPEKHYMVNPLKRMQEVEEYIELEFYFTLHAPRYQEIPVADKKITMVVIHEGFAAAPLPETMKIFAAKETAHQDTRFFYNNPLVNLGALVPWWLFS